MTDRIIVMGLGVIFLSGSAAVITLSWPDIRPALGLAGFFLVIYLLILVGWLLYSEKPDMPEWQKSLQTRVRPAFKLIPYIIGVVVFYFAYQIMVWLEWDWKAAGIFALIVGGLFILHFIGEAIIGGIFLGIGRYLWRYEPMRRVLTGLLLVITAVVILSVLFPDWFAFQ